MSQKIRYTLLSLRDLLTSAGPFILLAVLLPLSRIVPLSYADELYALRNHIELVRRKLLSA